MPKIFHIPGIIFLFCAFVLLFLVSVSLPYITALDFARVHFSSGSPTVGDDANPINELRFGSWAGCWYENDGNRVCNSAGNAYATTVYAHDNDSSVTVGPSWTRGLAIHPVATGVTLIAFLLSLSSHVTLTLLASLTSFLAALLTLIAFAVDIALFVFVKHQMGKLDGVSARTITAPGFWVTFVAFLLLCFAGCTVCFGRRRDRLDGATTYSWKDRFRASSSTKADA